jgi:plastocyanin
MPTPSIPGGREQPPSSLGSRLGRARGMLVAGLAALGLLAVACGGGGGDDGPTPVSESSGPLTEFTITAEDTLFDTSAFILPAGQEIRITFVNEDDSIFHNLRVFGPDGFEVKTEIFLILTEHEERSRELVFTAPAAGTYAFDCEVHPGVMAGVVTVQ